MNFDTGRDQRLEEESKANLFHEMADAQTPERSLGISCMKQCMGLRTWVENFEVIQMPRTKDWVSI